MLKFGEPLARVVVFVVPLACADFVFVERPGLELILSLRIATSRSALRKPSACHTHLLALFMSSSTTSFRTCGITSFQESKGHHSFRSSHTQIPREGNVERSFQSASDVITQRGGNPRSPDSFSSMEGSVRHGKNQADFFGGTRRK